MNKNYIILFLAILFSGITFAQQAQKNFINYQGVARNGADQLMANESMTIGIALKMGSATGASAYAENHAVTTDSNGVFSLKIGNGDVVSGAYNTIPWGNGATFVTVMVNGAEIGTTEMMAVPYALSSGDGSQTATEVPYDNADSGLAATNAQQAIDELVGSGAVDADADPTNEIQTISFDAATNEINLTDGGTITIPSGGTDADADPTNEIQTISFDAGTNELSLTDGGTVTIPSGGTDADADPTNELQDISLSGTDLSISEGSTIDLSAIIPPGGTDDQNAAEVPFDNAVSGLTATNTQTAIEELAAGGLVDTDDQDLSLSGTLLQITDGVGVDLGPLIPAGGTDDQNADEVPYDNTASGLTAADTQTAIDELATTAIVDTDDQNLSLSGTMLQITDGTGVDLGPLIPAGGTDDQNAGEVPYDNTASGLTAADTQTAIDELATTAIVDTDDQILSFDAITNILGIEDGNTVDLSSLAGGGGSSLWSANGSDLFYEDGNVGVGTSDIRASLHVKKNPASVQPLLMLEEESDDFARIAIRNEGIPALWNIMGRSYDPIASAEISSINFRYLNGLGGQEDVMTLSGNRRVGINTVAPSASLDVVGNIRSSNLGGGGNVVADTDGNLVIGAGGGGSSLWSENGSDINYNTGNVGIGNTNPGAEPGAGKYLTVATGISPSDNSFASIEIQGGQGTVNRPVGRLDFISNSSPGNSAIARIESRTSSGAQFRGDLAFSTQDGSSFGSRVLEERMTIKNNGNIGIGTSTPTAKLDVEGNIKSTNLEGTGTRNVVADANGNLIVESPSASSTPVVFKVQGRYNGVKALDRNSTIEADIWEVYNYDTSNSFNRTTKRFTAPETGYYFLHAVIEQSNNYTPDNRFFIKFNILSSFWDGTYVIGDDRKIEISGIYLLPAGREVYVQLRNDSTGSDVRIDGIGSLFEGYKIN